MICLAAQTAPFVVAEHKAEPLRDSFLQPLDIVILKFDEQSAISTHEVIVMLPRIWGSYRVWLFQNDWLRQAAVDKQLQRPIYRCVADS